MCSDWGQRLDDLPLPVRAWTSPACGSIHDRGVNAAVNFKNMAVSSRYQPVEWNGLAVVA